MFLVVVVVAVVVVAEAVVGVVLKLKEAHPEIKHGASRTGEVPVEIRSGERACDSFCFTKSYFGSIHHRRSYLLG